MARKGTNAPIARTDPSLASPFTRTAGRPRVYIVSNVRLLREGLSNALARDARIEVVGASDLDGAAEAIVAERPEVMLLDVSAPESLDLPRGLRSLSPELRSVAFAVADADVMACAEAGVSSYVALDGSAEDLVAAILRAVGGEVICSPRVAAALFARVAALAGRGDALSVEPLTPREQEIADLVACGLPNKTIARELSLAPATIKNHVHNILQKLGLQRRGEIIAAWPRRSPRPAAQSLQPHQSSL